MNSKTRELMDFMKENRELRTELEYTCSTECVRLDEDSLLPAKLLLTQALRGRISSDENRMYAEILEAELIEQTVYLNSQIHKEYEYLKELHLVGDEMLKELGISIIKDN
jgi:hypothetical protein